VLAKANLLVKSLDSPDECTLVGSLEGTGKLRMFTIVRRELVLVLEDCRLREFIVPNNADDLST
jgi:hypothetical protein